MSNSDDHSSLSDREMVEAAIKELAELREEAKTNPAITDEALAKIEESLRQFTASLTASEKADRELAASTQRLKLAADKLLAHPDTPDAKPLSVLSPKRKGN